MSIQNDRLDYVLKDRNLNQVSRETGIPYTSLYYFSKGERGLPSIYSSTLTKYYNTEVYRRFRNAGANSYEANYYKYKDPVSNWNIENSLIEKVNYFTEGSVLAASGYDISGLSKKAYQELYDTQKEKVIKGMRKNRDPLSDKVQDWWSTP